MASAKDVTIRPADYRDRQDILEIDVEDDGFDSLMDTLADSFDETGVHMFVAEDNDDLIGFAMLSEVDEDDKGGIIGEVRVAKRWQGKKVAEKLFWYALDYAKDKTGIEYIRTSTVKSLPKRLGAEEIGKMMYLNYEGDAKTLRTTLQSAPGLDDLPLAAVVPFKPRHLRKMLDPAVCENVLTKGFLFADGDTYSLCKENLSEFSRGETCLFVDKKQPIRSISFGNESDCSRAAVCAIDVNCKDIGLIKSHMIKQMKHACAEIEGNIIFSVLANGVEDEIKAFCEGIEGLEVCHDKPGYTGIVSKIVLSRE